MRTCVTAILAIIFLCAGIGGAIAADATPEASPAAPSPDAVLAALNASIEWYRDARGVGYAGGAAREGRGMLDRADCGVERR